MTHHDCSATVLNAIVGTSEGRRLPQGQTTTRDRLHVSAINNGDSELSTMHSKPPVRYGGCWTSGPAPAVFRRSQIVNNGTLSRGVASTPWNSIKWWGVPISNGTRQTAASSDVTELIYQRQGNFLCLCGTDFPDTPRGRTPISGPRPRTIDRG